MVVSARLALLPEEQRLFVLAHEGHHAAQGDREAVRSFLHEHILVQVPASELQERLAQLQPEVAALRHRQELPAHGAANRALKALGLSPSSAARPLLQHDPESPSHPSGALRLSRLDR